LASSKTRARKLAREKAQRQLRRRAEQVRRRRQVEASAAIAVAVLLAIGGVLWSTGVFSSKPKKIPAATCLWTPANTQANANLTDTGLPPTSGEPRSGTDTMTINTNVGTITASLELSKAPCAASSFHFLAGKKFFDNTSCHRLTTSGIYVLQCGDPSGTGSGGPSYTFADEYLPSAPPVPTSTASGASPSATATGSTVTYKAGTLAMANSGADTNGSQFFIVYKDSVMQPNYTIIGEVTSGLDAVQNVANAGAVDAAGKSAADGRPKTAVTISSLTVALPGQQPSPTPAATPSATATTTSPSPSAKS
jgi:peptidyl-prolyl cis-trans isomerase B (cyclophilin B)